MGEKKKKRVIRDDSLLVFLDFAFLSISTFSLFLSFLFCLNLSLFSSSLRVSLGPFLSFFLSSFLVF